MPFTTFAVGELVQNEDRDFVAQITAIGKEPVRWVEVAISDYVGLAQSMLPASSSGKASMEDTGHFSNRHRIIKVNGSDFDSVRATTDALCDYICSCLAELKRVYKTEQWNLLRAKCRAEAAKSGDKTAEQLFQERRKERKELRKRYFSEKKLRRKMRKRKKEKMKRKRERMRSAGSGDEETSSTPNTRSIGVETEEGEEVFTFTSQNYYHDYDVGSDSDGDGDGDFKVPKRAVATEEPNKKRSRSVSTLAPHERKEIKKEAIVIDEDGDLVAKVVDVGVDLNGDPEWIELAVSEFTGLSVKTLSCYCDELTTMKETGRMYKKVNRILRIESHSSLSLAKTLNKLCACIRRRLAAVRNGGMTEQDWERVQFACKHMAKKKGCTETAEQMMSRARERQEAYEQRYQAQREKRKKGKEQA